MSFKMQEVTLKGIETSRLRTVISQLVRNQIRLTVLFAIHQWNLTHVETIGTK
jgi:hypothetical protein